MSMCYLWPVVFPPLLPNTHATLWTTPFPQFFTFLVLLHSGVDKRYVRHFPTLGVLYYSYSVTFGEIMPLNRTFKTSETDTMTLDWTKEPARKKCVREQRKVYRIYTEESNLVCNVPQEKAVMCLPIFKLVTWLVWLASAVLSLCIMGYTMRGRLLGNTTSGYLWYNADCSVVYCIFCTPFLANTDLMWY